jgi:hypothetical protein
VSAKQRRQGRDNANAFGDSNVAYPSPTLEQTAAEIFGKIAEIDEGKQVAKPISIFDIYPDLTQPRRALPSVVRESWDGKPAGVSEMMAYWRQLAFEERGAPFDVFPYLFAQEEVLRPEKTGPIESSFLDLMELAASIRQHGLTNPITIARLGHNEFLLETGERRWLAYHILNFYESDVKSWEKIPARELASGADVWRQASENGVRANLNAISKARQIALLVMDIHRKKGATFRTFDQIVEPGSCDRAFYAQVFDGKRFPVTGYGEAVLNVMGFKQSSQFREHRELLGLPDEVWRLADDLNWTHGRIREMQRESGWDDKRLVHIAVSHAQVQGYTIGIPALDSPTPLKKQTDTPYLTQKNRHLLGRVRRMAVKVGQGGAWTTDDDLDDIEQMRAWLDKLEKAVRDKLKK